MSLMLAGMVVLVVGLYVAMPYAFSGEQLWSGVVGSGTSALTVRVCHANQAEAPDHEAGFPITIFWRHGYQPWCHQKTVTLNCDGTGLSYSCDGTMMRVSGGGEDRRWSMSIVIPH